MTRFPSLVEDIDRLITSIPPGDDHVITALLVPRRLAWLVVAQGALDARDARTRAAAERLVPVLARLTAGALRELLASYYVCEACRPAADALLLPRVTPADCATAHAGGDPVS